MYYIFTKQIKMSVRGLTTSIEELKNNKNNYSKISYRQVNPDKAVSGTQFAGGECHFRFSVGGSNWWIANRSFLSLRANLYSTGTTQPTLASDMGPAPGFTANLFTGCELRQSDTPISRITSNLPQIDAVRTRLMKSKSWIDSVGKSTNFWEVDYNARKQAIVSNAISEPKVAKQVVLTGTSIAIGADGVVTGHATCLLSTELVAGDILVVGSSRFTVLTATSATAATVFPAPAVAIAANTSFHREVVTNTTAAAGKHIIETTWQPPLGVFDLSTPLPPGDYDLVLFPNTSNFNSAAIQVASGAIGAKNLTVVNMFFNVCVVESENIPSDFTYYLDLHETQLQPRALAASITTEQIIDFSVPPTTYALSVAVQEIGAGSNPIYPPTQFTSASSQELNLTRLRLTYAGQVQPSPDNALDYTTAGTNYFTKLYLDYLMASNSFADGSVGESFDVWRKRGPIAHYQFLRPSGDGSTRVDCAISCSAATSNALLFSHYSNVAQISYKNGRCESVRVEYA